jgi:hypothetical protein
MGRSTPRVWDSAGLIFVKVEAGEKCVGGYGLQTSITAAIMSGIFCNHLLLQACVTTQL